MTSIPRRLKRKLRWPKKFAEIALLAGLVTAAGCAPKRFVIPAGTGAVMADYAAAWQRVASSCLGVRTLTAELGLSGRAGGTRLRGRVQAGFAPRGIRLEGVAPFGQPVFILAGGPSHATLLLPRDERVVTAPDAAEILDALVGVRLQAAALRDVLAGCAITGTPVSAASYGDITRFAFPEGAVYARRRGAVERIVAADVPPFLVEYPDAFAGGSAWPSRVRISRDAPDAGSVDLTMELTQLEINVDVPAAAFTIDIPPGTRPMTVAELRQAGPLGARN